MIDAWKTLRAAIKTLPRIFPRSSWSYSITPSDMNAALDSMFQEVWSLKISVRQEAHNKKAWEIGISFDPEMDSAAGVVQVHIPDQGWDIVTQRFFRLSNHQSLIPFLSLARDYIGPPTFDTHQWSALEGYYHLPALYAWSRMHLDHQCEGRFFHNRAILFGPSLNITDVLVPIPQIRLWHLTPDKTLRARLDEVHVTLMQGGTGHPENKGTLYGLILDKHGDLPPHDTLMGLRDFIEASANEEVFRLAQGGQ